MHIDLQQYLIDCLLFLSATTVSRKTCSLSIFQMPPRKRKVVEEESSADNSSGLSPLPEQDLESEEPKTTTAKRRKISESGGVAPASGEIASASPGSAIKEDVKEEDEHRDGDGEAEANEQLKHTPKRQPRKKVEVKKEATKADADDAAAVAKPATKKRKTKEEKEAEAMPLAARTIGHKLLVGAHVSSAGGQYFFRIQLYSVDSMCRDPAEIHIKSSSLN